MLRSFLLIALLFLLSCKTATYYIVRHAEKEPANTMTSDVPLSAAGKERAEALKDVLLDKNIKRIFATNFVRTLSTAAPLSEAIHVPVERYDPKDPKFVSYLRSINDNVLIVGHSNTVDDLVNDLSGRKILPGDLPDSSFGDLFVLKRKGGSISFEKRHFGK